MRVVYQDQANKNGAQASYRMLLQAMATEFPNDQFAIVCTRDSFLWSLGSLANVEVIPFEGGITKEWSRLCMETFGIGRIAKKHNADVIFSINVGPYVRTGIPQVLVVLNSFQVYPWWVAQYHPRSRFTLAMLRWLFRRSLRCCDAVQVETSLLAEYVRRMPGAPQRIEAIPKAVESTEDFEPHPLPDRVRTLFAGGLGPSTFTFVYVATSAPHKNHAVAMAAMEVLRSRGVAARLVLSLNEEQCRKCCGDELASSLIESGHVLPVGWIKKEELSALYDVCDACVMPSKLEQLSSAHLEAMHWQKPQISADVAYAHDLCGDAAIYADPDDPADWATKMQMLMENPQQRERLVAAGLERMKAFPKTWKEVARRVRAFLAEVANCE